MSQSLSRNFRRNQKDSRRNIALRIARIEYDNNQMAFTLMKNMAIAEGISTILIDKGICTKDEYNEALKNAAKLFNLVPKSELAKDPEEVQKAAKDIEKGMAEEDNAEREAVENGDPRGEMEEPNKEFDSEEKNDDTGMEEKVQTEASSGEAQDTPTAE